MCLIIYVGSQRLQDGEITAGQITTFLLYQGPFLGRCVHLSWLVSEAMHVLGASTKIVKIISQKPKINTEGGLILPESNGTLELENVHF